MFGIYRTVLALFVVVGHLYGPGQLGTYAVFAFYVLSGYLMTYIMHHNYGYDVKGRKRFALNRFLRIYPPYYAVILVSLLLLLLLGEQVTQFKPTIYMPATSKEWLQNLFLIFPQGAEPRLSPPTWALTVELFYYLAICLGSSRTKRITWIWLGASLFFTLYLVLTSAPWVDRYFSISAASLPFAVGSIIYHYKDWLLIKFKSLGMDKPFLWFGLMCINFLFFYSIETITEIPLTLWIGFYSNLFIVVCCLVALLDFKSKHISFKLDSTIGNYSYPIYLVHYQAGVIVFAITAGYLDIQFLTLKGLLFLLVSTALTVFVSYVIIKLIDEPVQRMRRKIRKNN